MKPAAIVGPETPTGYYRNGAYGESIPPNLLDAPSPSKVILWFRTKEEAAAFASIAKGEATSGTPQT